MKSNTFYQFLIKKHSYHSTYKRTDLKQAEHEVVRDVILKDT